MHLLLDTMSSTGCFHPTFRIALRRWVSLVDISDKPSENKFSKLPKESQLICGQGGFNLNLSDF